MIIVPVITVAIAVLVRIAVPTLSISKGGRCSQANTQCDAETNETRFY
jgi:hypothetical protein